MYKNFLNYYNENIFCTFFINLKKMITFVTNNHILNKQIQIKT